MRADRVAALLSFARRLIFEQQVQPQLFALQIAYRRPNVRRKLNAAAPRRGHTLFTESTVIPPERRHKPMR